MGFKELLSKENIRRIIILVILYVLLGNAEWIKANPMVPGAIVAVNMIVIVLAGILFGRTVGLSVGLIGTSLNALIFYGRGIEAWQFEFAAIIPHTIMGLFAGYLKEKTNVFGASFAIVLGHALNILMFLLFGLLAVSALTQNTFLLGLGYETVFGIISITILAKLYRKIDK